jgi:hypothetical protein
MSISMENYLLMAPFLYTCWLGEFYNSQATSRSVQRAKSFHSEYFLSSNSSLGVIDDS